MTPAEMQQAVIRGLKDKTGRDMAEWLEVLEAEDLGTRKEKVAWLKAMHGVGHVTATILADHAEGVAHAQLSPTDLLDQLFGDASTSIRAKLDEVLAFARELGAVEVVPCKGYVGLRTVRQIAAIRPKSGRLEIGLALAETASGDCHPVRGLGGGAISVGVWDDEPWRPLLEQAFRESLMPGKG